MDFSCQKQFTVDDLKVRIYEDRQKMGTAAAAAVTQAIKKLAMQQREIRMIFAAAPSQNEFLHTLVAAPNMDWSRVTAFHMDEYLGLPANAPQLFSNYLREHIFERVPFSKIHFIDASAADPLAEGRRYAGLLSQAPIDIVCMGIGENGHIAFNDPPVADFEDPETVKLVELDTACRQQQVNDGCFETLTDVPEKAITLTVPTLMSAARAFVVVPGPSKAEAVFKTLTGPVETACPASILRRHKEARLFLDKDSSAMLP